MSKLKRKETWRQANPRDQVVVMIMGAQGHLLHIASGLLKGEHAQDRANKAGKMLDEAQQILSSVPEGEW